MLAYCEICRVIYFDPPILRDRRDPAEGFRKLLEGEFFAYCTVCKRFQVFAPLPDGKNKEG